MGNPLVRQLGRYLRWPRVDPAAWRESQGRQGSVGQSRPSPALAKSTNRIAFSADQPSALRLPWLRVFRDFSSVVKQMPGYTMQSRGTARAPLPQARRLHLSDWQTSHTSSLRQSPSGLKTQTTNQPNRMFIGPCIIVIVEELFRNKAQERRTHYFKWPLTLSPHIPHKQNSSASTRKTDTTKHHPQQTPTHNEKRTR